ncbi:MAG TPA: hypothetical protein VHV51_18230 [Polyangiaceae bacterium]|nr:hypothetical protein [Polyangiaceae bacterium]
MALGFGGWLRIGACFALALWSAGDARADDVTPVELTMLGPDPVSVQVARGNTFPCDSIDDQILLRGKFAPGQVVRLSSPDVCVCMQQTYAPFPDVDWGPSLRICRPQICRGAGKGQRCVPAPDPTIRVRIRSNRE